MNNEKPTYEELEKRISQLEQELEIVREHKQNTADECKKKICITLDDIAEGNRMDESNTESNMFNHALVEIEAIRENEQWLNTIYDTVGDIIFHLAVESEGSFRFLSVNSAFMRVTGLSKAQIVGKTVAEVIPEPSLTMVLGKYRQAIETRAIVRWEETSEYPTGQLVGVVSVAPSFDAKGRCTHLVGSVHDITERNMAELSLLESEKRYRQLFENMNSGFVLFEVVLNEQGIPVDLIVLDANEGFEKTTGLNLKDSVGKHLTKILPGIDKDEADWIGTYSKVAHTGESIQFEQGSELLGYYYSISAFRAGPKQCAVTFLDITERKNAEEKLKKAALLLQSSIESPKDMIILSIDKDYNYLYFNECHKLAMLYAYGQDVKIGMNLLECITSDEDRIKAKLNYDKALSGESHITIQEYGDIEKSYYETRYNPVFNEKNEIIGTTAFSADITERKLAEKKIQDQNVYIKMILDNFPIGIATNEIDSMKVTYMNRKFSEIYGWSEDDFPYIEDFFEKVFPDLEYRQQLQERIMADISSGDSERMNWDNLMITTKAGEQRIVYAFNIPLISQNIMVSTVQDITERKNAEMERQKFAMLADSSSEFIGMCDLNLKPIYVNPSGILMLGLADLAEACRVKVQDYFFPEDQQFIAEDFFPRVMSEGHGDVEIRMRHFQTAEPVWVLYYLFRVCDDKGQPVGWATVSRDITERKNAEESLKITSERLLLATEGANLGIWNWNTVTGELIWSNQCKVLFGIGLNETMSYQRFIDALHPDDRERTNLAVKDALDNHKYFDLDYRSLWPDGSIHWLAAKGRGYYDAMGKAVRMEGILLDITQRKHAEEEIRMQLDELKRWHLATLGREGRILELKKEVNDLLHQRGEALRYGSTISENTDGETKV